MHDLAHAHWIYDRRLRDEAMRDTLRTAPHLFGLALQNGLHMRHTDDHVAGLHGHLEDTRGELRQLLHECLHKQDALQEQLHQLTRELALEREAAAAARAAAEQAQQQAQARAEQAQHERAELLSFIRRIKRLRFWKR